MSSEKSEIAELLRQQINASLEEEAKLKREAVFLIEAKYKDCPKYEELFHQLKELWKLNELLHVQVFDLQEQIRVQDEAFIFHEYTPRSDLQKAVEDDSLLNDWRFLLFVGMGIGFSIAMLIHYF